MNSLGTSCETIQESIAIGQTLTPEQAIHVAGCVDCAMVQSEFTRLDNLVNQAMMQTVPPGFAERVMARLPTRPRVTSENLFGERLPALFTHSRLLQAIWLGLGIILGAIHIVRFFLGVFVAGMAAAS